jgi:hypothetical protein
MERVQRIAFVLKSTNHFLGHEKIAADYITVEYLLKALRGSRPAFFSFSQSLQNLLFSLAERKSRSQAQRVANLLSSISEFRLQIVGNLH